MRWVAGGAGPVLDQVEPRFGTPFHIERLSEAVIHRLSHAPENPRLHFPAPNPFIPSDLTLKPLPGSSSVSKSTSSGDVSPGAAVGSGDGISPPVFLASNPVGRLWHKQDDIFKLPRSTVKVFLFSPAVQQHKYGSLLTELWTEVVDDGAFPVSWLIPGPLGQLLYLPLGFLLHLSLPDCIACGCA